MEEICLFHYVVCLFGCLHKQNSARLALLSVRLRLHDVLLHRHTQIGLT